MAHAKIQRWGNSLAVRLPKEVVRRARMAEGASVEIEAQEGKIVVRGVHRYSLEELLAGVRRSNLHDEVSTGDTVGREVW